MAVGPTWVVTTTFDNRREDCSWAVRALYPARIAACVPVQIDEILGDEATLLRRQRRAGRPGIPRAGTRAVTTSSMHAPGTTRKREITDGRKPGAWRAAPAGALEVTRRAA